MRLGLGGRVVGLQAEVTGELKAGIRLNWIILTEG